MVNKCIFFLIIMSFLLTFAGCNSAPANSLIQSSRSEQTLENSMPTVTSNPMYTDISLSAFKTNDGVLIKLGFPKFTTVQFRANRACIEDGGLTLINNESLQMFLGKELQALGDYHVDMGSGFFIPSYITTDGYLISFYVDENNIIYSAIKRDLFTNTTVEDVSSTVAQGTKE